jgi:hypothetical protein
LLFFIALLLQKRWVATGYQTGANAVVIGNTDGNGQRATATSARNTTRYRAALINPVGLATDKESTGSRDEQRR